LFIVAKLVAILVL